MIGPPNSVRFPRERTKGGLGEVELALLCQQHGQVEDRRELWWDGRSPRVRSEPCFFPTEGLGEVVGVVVEVVVEVVVLLGQQQV